MAMVSDSVQRRIARFTHGEAVVTLIADVTGIAWHPDYQVPAERLSELMPDLRADGVIVTDCTFAHVSVGAVSAVVDPSYWSTKDRASHPDAIFSDGTDLLRSLGVESDAITHVVITHGHYDHFTGVTAADGRVRYPRAQHLISKLDWDCTEGFGGLGIRLHSTLRPIVEAGLLKLTVGDHELSTEVQLVATPGETPGHVVVRVESAGRSLFLAADLFHGPAEIEHIELARPHCDLDSLRTSRLRILRESIDKEALLALTHAPFPGVGRVTESRGKFKWLPVVQP